MSVAIDSSFMLRNLDGLSVGSDRKLRPWESQSILARSAPKMSSSNLDFRDVFIANVVPFSNVKSEI
jgi:hypothetical protein